MDSTRALATASATARTQVADARAARVSLDAALTRDRERHSMAQADIAAWQSRAADADHRIADLRPGETDTRQQRRGALEALTRQSAHFQPALLLCLRPGSRPGTAFARGGERFGDPAGGALGSA